MRRLAFVTCLDFPEIVEDEAVLVSWLEERGCTVVAAAWDRKHDDAAHFWAGFELVVLRSCWNYHEHSADFVAWLDMLEKAGVPVCNDLRLLRWNLDKRYLREVQEAGLTIIPTRWHDPEHREATALDLRACMNQEGWEHIIVKPTVSAGSYETWQLTPETLPAHTAHIARIAEQMPLMIQPFMPQILEEGEWSFLYFDGVFSHAVRKVPKQGDFRIQEQFGGQTLFATAPDFLRQQAEAVKDWITARHTPLYLRVDGLCVAQQFWLMEIEAIEPSLFLNVAPGATERFGHAILAKLSSLDHG